MLYICALHSRIHIDVMSRFFQFIFPATSKTAPDLKLSTHDTRLKHIQNFPSVFGDTEKCFQHLQVQAANHNQWLCWQGWKRPLHLPVALWDWFHPFWSFYRWWVNVSLLWNLVIRLIKSTASLFFLYSFSMHARLYVFFFWSVLFFLKRPQKRKSCWPHVNSSFERWTFTAIE